MMLLPGYAGSRSVRYRYEWTGSCKGVGGVGEDCGGKGRERY